MRPLFTSKILSIKCQFQLAEILQRLFKGWQIRTPHQIFAKKMFTFYVLSGSSWNVPKNLNFVPWFDGTLRWNSGQDSWNLCIFLESKLGWGFHFFGYWRPWFELLGLESLELKKKKKSLIFRGQNWDFKLRKNVPKRIAIFFGFARE